MFLARPKKDPSVEDKPKEHESLVCSHTGPSHGILTREELHDT